MMRGRHERGRFFPTTEWLRDNVVLQPCGARSRRHSAQYLLAMCEQA